MQLPFFLKTPAVAIIGDTCYSSLIEDFNYRDVECIKYGISKGLGLGIVAGGAIVKVPQIIKIVQARTAKGISLPSYMLETFACVVSLAYNIRQNNPISTYGETFFVTIQNLIILGLMLHYSGKNTTAFMVLSSFLFFGNILGRSTSVTQYDGSVVTTAWVSKEALTVLQGATIPINLFSKIPQIVENHRNKSTGQLSAFTIFNYFAGSLARVYTTLTEVDDVIILSGFLLSTLFNCILALQMALYWNNSSASPVKVGEKGSTGSSDTKKRVKKLD
ncbi:mannose-P-dolichol utilization defect 1 [Entomortierella parvispora]|uniref:Mannose-P-dolichol utilization defect 1 protein homolog n=1 Tax=Entomortierella parvispora TaxID=205924 RepID=A0A9P3LXN0_9FUNG|nr:mannose-P-dolichol utilization defect 1 [Entomortierella parvispora]